MIQIKTDSCNLIETYQNLSSVCSLCRMENDFTFWRFSFMFYILLTFAFSIIIFTAHTHKGFSVYYFILESVTSRKNFRLVRLQRFAKSGSDLLQKEREFYPNCSSFWFGIFQWSVTFENIPVALPTADLERRAPLADVIVTKQNLISFKVTVQYT